VSLRLLREQETSQFDAVIYQPPAGCGKGHFMDGNQVKKMKSKHKTSSVPRITGRTSILLWLCGAAIFFLCFTNAALAQPKRLETAEPGDCKACHGTQKVLPEKHKDTAKMTASECGKCHKPGTGSLRTKLLLAHLHLLNDIGCRDCHDSKGAHQAITTAQCLSCHGSYDEVAAKTAGSDPDPHNSPHYGKEQDCDLCHHQHEASENFCSQCHEWKLTVP